MLKRITLLFITAVVLVPAMAGHISEQMARQVARAFMHSRLPIDNSATLQSLTSGPVIEIGENPVVLYAFNFDRGGYVLVSATDAAIPVPGYSLDGYYSHTNQPPAMAAWIAGYELQIREIIEESLPADDAINSEWNALLQYNPAVKTAVTGVEPLLPSTWDQGSRYNDLCPEDSNGPGGHVYAGCVATAMSQVMYYWRYPLSGIGSHGYQSSYGYLFVDFAEAVYDYEQMRNEIGPESNYEMAELQYHAGVSVDMMYSSSGSGAYSFDAANSLKQYFGYSDQLSLRQKNSYSNQEWAQLLISNIDNGWPMYYNGYGSGGHAFNVDGYQGSDYFHFNWGWSGSYNGYFYLNNLNPGGNNFTQGQGAIVNFYPESNYPYYCNGLKTLTRHNGTIEDGSGPVDNYIAGLNCGWLIAPNDSVTGLSILFEKFNLSDGDVLNVFDGPDTSHPLLGSFTGSEIPGAITATHDRMYIEFLTEGDEGSGFRISYNSTLAEYCSGTTTYNEASGIIFDGSGSRTYNNNSLCKFRVEPENASSITFYFRSLDTEPDNDVIKIYNLASQQIVATISGNELPEPVTVPSGKAMMLFSSNGSITGQGWEIEYTSSSTSVDATYMQTSDKLRLQVNPMPCKEWMNIEISAPVSAEMSLVLTDLSGREVRNYGNHAAFNGRVLALPVYGLQSGLYLLKYVSPAGSGISKVMIAG
jgi:hypothetical protein